MHQCGLERLSLDLDRDLLIARRRADSCTPGSPSWDAAMGLVQELEDEMHRVEQGPDAPRDLLVLAHTSD